MATMRPKTEKKIKQVFTRLIQTKGFNNLTVSDIARGAAINRGTFYLHFTDKFALLKYYEDQTIAKLTEYLTAQSSQPSTDPLGFISKDAIYHALVYAQQDREFVSALASDKGDPKFIVRFKGILAKVLARRVAESPKHRFNRQGIPTDYASEILLSSITSIILLWLHKGATEDPKAIADLIDQCKQLAPVELLS